MKKKIYDSIKKDISGQAIVKALFETYESVYDIDAKSFAYKCYHESHSFSGLKIKNIGDNFFEDVKHNIPNTIYYQDQEYVSMMLSHNSLINGVNENKYYSFVYRLMINGVPVYHKIRAIKEIIENREHILLGVRNVDETFQQEKIHTEAIISLTQKEKNHLEAILASSIGYLEFNLTKDEVIEVSLDFLKEYESKDVHGLFDGSIKKFSDFECHFIDTLAVNCFEEAFFNGIRYYLIKCCERGEKKKTKFFSIKKNDGSFQPCKTIFFLYKDTLTDDIMSFAVLYDLSEQQRKEEEIRSMEQELQMSRIRSFTSQIQPHYLYNALGSIQEIMLENPVYASSLLDDFMVHLRSCIEVIDNNNTIPFKKELDNIEAYVNIEKIRFGEKLRVIYDIKPIYFQILPLSIQPLVENAIRHGIYNNGLEGGTVIIRTMEKKDSYVVEVEDNGVGFDYDSFDKEFRAGQTGSKGLNNIKYRMEKTMNARMRVYSKMGKGTKITLTIPKGEEIESNNS